MGSMAQYTLNIDYTSLSKVAYVAPDLTNSPTARLGATVKPLADARGSDGATTVREWFPARAHHNTVGDLVRRTSIYLSVFSIAALTSGESGVTAGSKRATTLPSRSTRNLVKFHLISPATAGLAAPPVRKW